MGYRLSKITTKQGDSGTSALADGQRTLKSQPVFHLLGDLDELIAQLGVLKCRVRQQGGYAQQIEDYQHQLMDLCGQVAMPEHEIFKMTHVESIEEQIEYLNQHLPPLKEFLIPGTGMASSHCHLARAICRRAERQAVAYYEPSLASEQNIAQGVIAYLNRLSDLLFILARTLDRLENGEEVLWKPDLKAPNI